MFAFFSLLSDIFLHVSFWPFFLAIAPPFCHHCTAVRSTAQQNILSCFLLKLNVCWPIQWNFLIESILYVSICGVFLVLIQAACLDTIIYSLHFRSFREWERERDVSSDITFINIFKFCAIARFSVLLFVPLFSYGYKFGLGLNFLLLLCYILLVDFWTFISIFLFLFFLHNCYTRHIIWLCCVVHCIVYLGWFSLELYISCDDDFIQRHNKHSQMSREIMKQKQTAQ